MFLLSFYSAWQCLCLQNRRKWKESQYRRERRVMENEERKKEPNQNH